MSETLLPCPWCADDAWILEDRDGPLLYRPQCKSCGGGLGGFDRRAEAIAAWNRRADLSEQNPPDPHGEKP